MNYTEVLLMHYLEKNYKTKFLLIILLLFILLLSVACQKTKGEMRAQLIAHDFEESIEIADLIVEVEILSIKGESVENSIPETFFNCSINKYYKGDIDDIYDDEIIIMQAGNSEWTVNSNRLFDPGEKYIFFLKKATGYVNTYWLISEEMNCYLIETYNAKEYIIKNSNKDAKLKEIECEEMEGIVVDELESRLNGQERIHEVQVMEKEAFVDLLIDTISIEGGK
jgi:hypothetical protein